MFFPQSHRKFIRPAVPRLWRKGHRIDDSMSMVMGAPLHDFHPTNDTARDFVSGNLNTATNAGFTRNMSDIGVSVRGTRAADAYLEWSVPSLDAPSTSTIGSTVRVIAKLDANAALGLHGMIGVFGTAGNNRMICLVYWDDANNGFYTNFKHDTFGGLAHRARPTANLWSSFKGQWHDYVFTHSGVANTPHTIWIDGVNIAQTTMGDSATSGSSTNDTVRMGVGHSSIGSSAEFLLIEVYNRALTGSEIQELGYRPWKNWTAPPAKYWFLEAGADTSEPAAPTATVHNLALLGVGT